MIAALVACSRMNPEVINVPEEKPQEEQQEEVIPTGTKVLTITAHNSDTKTSYAGEITFSWNEGDQISVICNDGDNNMWVTFTATTAAASSTFTSGEVAGNVVLGALDGTKVALYPASEHHVYGGSASGQISFNIPAERDFRSSESGHQESAIPMFAWGTDENTYAFSNLTGAAKFTITGLPCSTVKMVYTVPSAKLNGSFNLLYDSINTANSTNVHWDAATSEHDSEKTVTYYGDVIGETASFYLPYAEGTIDGPSTLQLIDAATDMVLYNNTHVGDISINENQIAVLPNLSLSFHSAYNIDWSSVPSATNSSDAYQGLKKFKAKADDTYIYLYIEAAPNNMCLIHEYDSYFHFYIEDASGTDIQYWWDYDADDWIKLSEIDATHTKWAVKDGNIAFITYGTDESYSSNLLMHPYIWYYEIRMKRSVDDAFANAGTIKIGVVLDDTYKEDDVWGHYYNEDPYGVVPTYYEDPLYELTLP